MNKSLKIVVSIIIILISLWVIIFFIDFMRCASFKMPIFVVAGETADDGGSGTYYGLGYKVEVKKHISADYGGQLEKIEMYMFDKFITGAIAQINILVYSNDIEDLPENYNILQAINDRCVVRTNNAQVFNKDELDKFLENVNNNTPDFIRCIAFTTEGDMIITDVEFEGNNIFSVCKDLTRDKYSSKDDRTYKYGKFSKLVVDETDDGTNIFLEQSIEGSMESVYVCGYRKNEVIINDYENNYLLKVTTSDNKEKTKITTGELADKYEYDIYYYGLEMITIRVDNEDIDLKEALLNNKVTMEQIIEQAEKDAENEIIYSDMYKDGGSRIYYYKTYTIIKSYSLDGNRDVYIGTPEMMLSQVR